MPIFDYCTVSVETHLLLFDFKADRLLPATIYVFAISLFLLAKQFIVLDTSRVLIVLCLSILVSTLLILRDILLSGVIYHTTGTVFPRQLLPFIFISDFSILEAALLKEGVVIVVFGTVTISHVGIHELVGLRNLLLKIVGQF